ncbi:MAG: DUF309 domain-containing protein [Desulforhopalus sp.]
MKTQNFNPFEDRLSRDLRNDLSKGFAAAIESGDNTKLLETVAYYRGIHIDDCYSEYLEDRYEHYQQALKTIQNDKNKIDDTIHQALVLWDHELFFEVHEVLEHSWYSAEGQLKLTLQALIRAAGVYIKREYGFSDAAARIGAKAIPVLTANSKFLDQYFEVEKLTTALQSEDPPPKLLSQKR